jgi:hypothetical protein
LRLPIIMVCFSLSQPFAARAQTNIPAALPPAAQEALNKGIIAAKVPDYLLAIRYFEDARKIAPTAPVIFMNLGIAESKMPGRELRAIAWFGAYLAATPDAPNAAAVKEQIAVLEVRNQSNVSRLIKAVQDAAGQTPKNLADPKLRDVATVFAESGDFASALNLAKSMDDEMGRSSAQSSIAEVQAKAGDITSALKTVDIITRPDYKGQALYAVADAQLAANDVAGAQRTLVLTGKIAELRKAPDYEVSRIAIAQAKAADIAGAQKTVTSIKTDVSATTPEKSGPQLEIAKAQLKSGDIAGALKTAEFIQHAGLKIQAQQAVAESQAEAGDFAGALKVAALIRDANYKIQAQKTVAEAQIKTGDLAGAQKTADSIESDGARDTMWASINYARLKAGDIAGAQKSVDLIRDNRTRDGSQNAIASAQAEAGDITGARKTAAAIQDATYKSQALRAIVEAQAKSGEIAGAQKTAELITDASERSRAQRAIVRAQLERRDVAGAQRIAALIEFPFYKTTALLAIAETQTKGGDLVSAKRTFVEARKAADLVQGTDKAVVQLMVVETQVGAGEIADAQKTADQIQNGFHKDRALLAVAAAKTKAGLAGAPVSNSEATAAWLVKLEDDDKGHACPLNTGPFLDLTGHLKSLPRSNDPNKVFDGLLETARQIVTAQNVIHQMLKQQDRK